MRRLKKRDRDYIKRLEAEGVFEPKYFIRGKEEVTEKEWCDYMDEHLER